MPRIKMGANQYKFVRFICTRNICKQIKRIETVIVEMILHIQLDVHRHFVIQRPDKTPIMLTCYYKLEWYDGRIDMPLL